MIPSISTQPRDLLADIKELARRGADSSVINAHIRSETGGRFTDAASYAQSNRPRHPAEGITQLLRSAAQGATMGFSDELRGVGAAIAPGGQDYTQARDAERASLAQTRAEHPLLSMGAEAAGGLVIPFGAVAKGFKLGNGLLGQTLGGAGIGGLSGLLSGVGYSEEEEPGNVAKDATTGAVLGAGLGAALPVVARSLAAGGRKFSDVIQDLRHKDVGIQRHSQRVLIEALRKVGYTPAQAASKAKEMAAIAPGEAIVADLEAGLGTQLQHSMSEGVGVRTRVLDDLERRMHGRADRLTQAAEEGMGTTTGQIATKKTAAIAKLQDMGSKLFGTIDDLDVTQKDRQRLFVEFWNDPAFARLDPARVSRLRRLYDAPTKMGQLRQLKRELNNEASMAFRNGDAMAGELWMGQKQAIDDVLEDFVPGYHQVNERWRAQAVKTPTAPGAVSEHSFQVKGGARMQDAWAEGESALGLRADEVRKRMADLIQIGGPETAEAFRLGWLDAFTTKMANAKANDRMGDALVNMSDNAEEIYRMMFPNDGAFLGFRAKAGFERAARRTEQLAGATPRVPGLGAETEMSREGSILAEAAGFGAMRSPWSIVRIGRIAQKILGKDATEEAHNVVTKFLASKYTPETQRMFDQLQQMVNQKASPTQLQSVLGQMGVPMFLGSRAGSLMGPQ